MEEWKIAMIGDVGVGKISFAFQAINGCFCDVLFPLKFRTDLIRVSQEIDSTLDETYCSQFVVDDRRCTVELLLPYPTELDAGWANRLTYTAQAWVLVYSITSRATFDHLIALSPQVATQAKLEGGPVLVVLGNKCDLHEARREVPKKEGEELARWFGCHFCETSAKTGQNVGLQAPMRRRPSAPHATIIDSASPVSIPSAALTPCAPGTPPPEIRTTSVGTGTPLCRLLSAENVKTMPIMHGLGCLKLSRDHGGDGRGGGVEPGRGW
ncbi:Ras protein [Mycena venus]|uniref:small monomeric GTPase n=1 Tax=Mycena venus TaxID=2733690 RepID=A0A8H6Z3K8_9AGAR|nr:Ras protein [Mycena venus]